MNYCKAALSALLTISTVLWLVLPDDPSKSDLELMASRELIERKAYVKQCQDNLTSRDAWVTAIADDGYLLPLTVLATTIEKFSCIRTRIAIAGQKVTRKGEAKLYKLGYRVVRPKIEYSCPGINKTRWNGTFLRFCAFSMTEFNRIIYVDGDFMLLSNIDDVLADVRNLNDVAAAQFERPMTRSQLLTVWSDNGFNAGLVAFRPQDGLEDRVSSELIRLGCNLDQPLLNHIFTQDGWNLHLLPFSYNVRKVNYHPMRAFHFAGGPHMKVRYDNFVRLVLTKYRSGLEYHTARASSPQRCPDKQGPRRRRQSLLALPLQRPPIF